MASKTKVVRVREVSLAQAQKEILAYLDSHDRAYPSDVADNLELDYDLVVRAMRELRKTGEVSLA